MGDGAFRLRQEAVSGRGRGAAPFPRQGARPLRPNRGFALVDGQAIADGLPPRGSAVRDAPFAVSHKTFPFPSRHRRGEGRTQGASPLPRQSGGTLFGRRVLDVGHSVPGVGVLQRAQGRSFPSVSRIGTVPVRRASAKVPLWAWVARRPAKGDGPPSAGGPASCLGPRSCGHPVSYGPTPGNRRLPCPALAAMAFRRRPRRPPSAPVPNPFARRPAHPLSDRECLRQVDATDHDTPPALTRHQPPLVGASRSTLRENDGGVQVMHPSVSRVIGGLPGGGGDGRRIILGSKNRERQTALPVLQGKTLPQAAVRRRNANPATPKANNAKAVGSGTAPSV